MFFGKKNTSNSEESGSDEPMPLLEHIRELRKRVLYSFYFFLFWFLICYVFRFELLSFLKEPIEEPLARYSQGINFSDKEISSFSYDCECTPIDSQPEIDAGKEASLLLNEEGVNLKCHCDKKDKKNPASMVFLSIPEVFLSELKAAFFSSLFFSVPFLILQIGMFIFPALYKRNEKALFWYFAIGGYLFFLFGAVFGYFVVFPIGFDFFLSLTRPGEIVPAISVNNYLNFSLVMLFCFGLVFELPLAIFTLTKLGFVTPKQLLKNINFVLVGILIVSAILTPPDPFSMLLMAVPLVVLYFIGIFFSMFAIKKAKSPD